MSERNSLCWFHTTLFYFPVYWLHLLFVWQANRIALLIRRLTIVSGFYLAGWTKFWNIYVVYMVARQISFGFVLYTVSSKCTSFTLCAKLLSDWRCLLFYKLWSWPLVSFLRLVVIMYLQRQLTVAAFFFPCQREMDRCLPFASMAPDHARGAAPLIFIHRLIGRPRDVGAWELSRAELLHASFRIHCWMPGSEYKFSSLRSIFRWRMSQSQCPTAIRYANGFRTKTAQRRHVVEGVWFQV